MSKGGGGEEGREVFTPKTALGRMVIEGTITSIDEVFEEGLRIREPEIVDILLPNLEEEVLDINLVQKQTDAGERSKFKAIVVVGNRDGYVGVGGGKARQVREAINKAIIDAKLNVIPVRRGCGSWDCRCSEKHSIPFRVQGKCGSVKITLIPASKGTSIVGASLVKAILSLAGIKDCWTRTRGQTKNAHSLAFATYSALKNLHAILTPADWAS
ncbi:TPA: 30S ribosomal protein S5 [Candidatus Bathyarchaeota archaeon]|nr:30S ribosomal protein S5 [Candidatus Bathyarchaeota archaeon]